MERGVFIKLKNESVAKAVPRSRELPIAVCTTNVTIVSGVE
jgi:hypothetical protein